ncbi:MAG: helix-hairpin-helix domain-containing protein, partial [Candidatus Caldipriscus sp.]
MFFLFSYISLNTASLEDLRKIFPPDIADSVYKYRQLSGEFESIYELRNVPGVTDEIFAKVVDSLVLNSPEEMDTVNLGGRISDVISQSVREESPSDLSREYWIFLGGNPINPNKASVYELMNIYGVSFKDALAVIKWR